MNNNTNVSETQEYSRFLSEIKSRIRSAQYEAMKAVNKEMIALYWELGKRIYEQQNLLGWGRSVVENLSKDIQKEFPGVKGFGTSNRRTCLSIRLSCKHLKNICWDRRTLTRHCPKI